MLFNDSAVCRFRVTGSTICHGCVFVHVDGVLLQVKQNRRQHNRCGSARMRSLLRQSPNERLPSFFPMNKGLSASQKRSCTAGRRSERKTYPKNLRAETAGGLTAPFPTRTFIVRTVTNSHCAFSPSAVPSAVHVLNAMLPSEAPVANIPRCE